VDSKTAVVMFPLHGGEGQGEGEPLRAVQKESSLTTQATKGTKDCFLFVSGVLGFTSCKTVHVMLQLASMSDVNFGNFILYLPFGIRIIAARLRTPGRKGNIACGVR